MAGEAATRIGWFPQRGSWEEAVLSWNEQVDLALRRRGRNQTSLSRMRERPLRMVSNTSSEVNEDETPTALAG